MSEYEPIKKLKIVKQTKFTVDEQLLIEVELTPMDRIEISWIETNFLGEKREHWVYIHPDNDGDTCKVLHHVPNKRG